MANEKYSRNDNQILRIDGKNCFVEVMNSCFAIHKLLIRFIQYDAETNKVKVTMEHYMDFPDALGLAELILTGTLQRYFDQAESAGKFKGQSTGAYTSYYTKFTGKSYASGSKSYTDLKAQFPKLRDVNGQVILSKQLKIQRPSRGDYYMVLRSEYSNGKLEETGAVSPAEVAFAWITVALTDINALGMASMIKASINAYLSQFYTAFSPKLFPGDKCEVFEAIAGYKKSETKAPESGQSASMPSGQSTEAKKPVAQAKPSPEPVREKPQAKPSPAPSAQENPQPSKPAPKSSDFPLHVKFVEKNLIRDQNDEMVASVLVSVRRSNGDPKEFRLYFRIDDMGARKAEIGKAIRSGGELDIMATSVDKGTNRHCYFVA